MDDLIAVDVGGREDNAGVQEAVDCRQQVLAVVSLVRRLVEELRGINCIVSCWFKTADMRQVALEPTGTYLVRHKCGDGASNLMVVDVGRRRAQQKDEEPNRNRNLQDGVQQHRLL